jgi:hypothetical protein
MSLVQSIVCPSCKTSIDAGSVALGQAFHCPTCQESFTLRARLVASMPPPPVPPGSTAPHRQTAAPGPQPLAEAAATGLPSSRSMDFYPRLLDLLRRGLQEAKAIALATAAQALRLGHFAAGQWRGTRLKQEAFSVVTGYGEGLNRRGLGDAPLREQISRLDVRIAQLRAGNASPRALEGERAALLAKLAQPFLTQGAPAGLENEHQQAVTAASAAGSHTDTLRASRASLFPAERREMLRVAVGSGAAFLILAGLGWSMRSSRRTSSGSGSRGGMDPGDQGGDSTGGAGFSDSGIAQPDTSGSPSNGTCNFCFGTGQQTCTVCGGSGNRICLNCNGLGQVRSGPAMIACFTCNGSGRQRCTNFSCNFGKVQCLQCGGTGRR